MTPRTPFARLGGRLLLGLPALLGACSGGQDAGGPSNVILISIDTLRADHLGAYGYERETSPHLDALAADGVLFESATATAPWTLPAHVSMLTGLYARTHGVDGWTKRLPAGVATLPERLSAQGFRTAAFVNVDMLSPDRGFGRGFDVYRLVPAARTPAGTTTRIVEQVRAWIERGQGPFFAFVHLYDVHSDYQPLPAYRESFARPYDGPADGTTEQLLRFREGALEGWGAAEAAHLVDLYDAGIRQLDSELRPLLAWLDTEGPGAETLLIVTSDHGEEFLEHGSVLHGRTLYQELVHVPLILHGPGVPAGERFAGDASLVDLAPTVLGLLELEPLLGAEGRDLSLAWRRPAQWSPDHLVFSEADRWKAMQEGDRRRAVRKGRHKLHRDQRSGRLELYDLATDPGEHRDLAADQPTLVEVLGRELERFESGSREVGADLELSPAELEELRRLGYL